MSIGYLYIICNDDLPIDMLKIGVSTLAPELIAQEFTDKFEPPSPYRVLHKVAVLDCSFAEYVVLTKLERYRKVSRKHGSIFDISMDKAKRAIDVFRKAVDNHAITKQQIDRKRGTTSQRETAEVEKPSVLADNKVFSKRKRNIEHQKGVNELQSVKKSNRRKTKKLFYVYEYVNKHTGVQFYIGKGKEYRFSAHMKEARKTDIRNPKLDMIRDLNFEDGVKINIIENNLHESKALALEVRLIREIGRKDLGNGPLLNLSDGGEGISGGVDQYGYLGKGIARFITDIVHQGEYIQEMSRLVRQYITEQKMQVKWIEERIIPHIQEMGNVGCHYKGPKIFLRGWQFSLDRKMIDVNLLTLSTKGFLKVHGDLPFNEGSVSAAPVNYDFGQA